MTGYEYEEKCAKFLEAKGFTDIKVFGGDAGESEGPGGKRVYFLCKKP